MIAVVEDEKELCESLKMLLTEKGYEIVTARSCGEADKFIGNPQIDMFLLDVKLPDGSGFDICRKIRKSSEVPVIFLTSCDNEEEIVTGLDIGADDYITKPFDMNELSARIQVNIRKQKKENLTYKDIDINVANYTAKISNEQISLSKTEFELLKILVEHSEEVVTRDQIIEKLWGWDASDNLLDSTMKKLRQKIPENYIKTMRGIGYILKYEDKN